MNEQDGAVLVGREADIAMRLGTPVFVSKGYCRVPVTVTARGISATGWAELEDWNGGGDAFVEFFADLAERWRGWAGAREWRGADATVKLSATHDGKGLVVLRVDVSNLGYDAPGSWSARADVPIEPGALADVADRVRGLLARVTFADAD